MVKLYCSEYCVRKCGWNSPKSRIGRNKDQSTQPLGPAESKHGVLGAWWMTAPPLLGSCVPSCRIYGVLNIGLDKNALTPKGGSALNCSRTSCSIGL